MLKTHLSVRATLYKKTCPKHENDCAGSNHPWRRNQNSPYNGASPNDEETERNHWIPACWTLPGMASLKRRVDKRERKARHAEGNTGDTSWRVPNQCDGRGEDGNQRVTPDARLPGRCTLTSDPSPARFRSEHYDLLRVS
jgi:hypothetical protein